ncbi:MAG TPA: ATP-binding protein [Solirubrobacteraceae bacterium]
MAEEPGGLGRLTLLARASEILDSTLAYEDGLQRLAALLARSVADWCAIDVREPDGVLHRLAAAPGEVPLGPRDPHGPAIVMRTCEPDLVADVRDERLRALGVVSTLCVPLPGREGPIGALSLLAGTPYRPQDAELASELARRAAAAVETARSERRYRLLFERNPMPMWVYDVQTLGFLAVNEAAVRHYGYAREEFLAMRITDIRPHAEVEALMADLERAGAGSPLPNTWTHRRKDGSLISVEITAGRIAFGGRDAALVLAHDVSERKQLEERLAEAERLEAIGRLAGGVAHDFNNLLTVISGYASMLLAGAAGDSEELREIAHAAEQASGLTRQLLAFSRRQVLHPQVLDLNEIVAGMEPMLHRIIGDDVSVGVRLVDRLAPVEADRAQLERVLLNLAANARDAMPNGGRLTIETANVDLDADYVTTHGEGAPGPHVMLAVSDTGVGMSEDVQRHLFEPFFTTKESGAGTGLGLATVFGVVKQSGGSIYVYSEIGKGSTLKVYFPAAAAGREPEPPTAAEPAGADGSETIMVVEDDASVRDLVRLMLEARGYAVLTVEDAEEAARVCRESPGGVDLLLTDVVMPEVGGRDLAERLVEIAPEMRILFMSGYSDEAVYRHGVISPNAAFIEKPFTERTLAGKVREVLDA